MQFRVWNVVNFPGPATYHPVTTPAAGAEVIQRLVGEQERDPTVESNAFGLEVYEAETGEWVTWYDEEGRNVDEAFDLL